MNRTPANTASAPSAALRLKLSKQATPENVICAAKTFMDLLESQDVDSETVTMVVRNLDLRADLRARTPESNDFVEDVIGIIRDGAPHLAARPQARPLAQALADQAQSLQEMGAELRVPGVGKGTLLAKLNTSFIKKMEALAESAGTPLLRGETTVYSPVLRFGLLREQGPLRARLIIDGRPKEVDVSDGAKNDFWDAAVSQKAVRVRLVAEWIPHDNNWVLNTRRCRAIGIDDSWSPKTGAELLGTNPSVLSSDSVRAIREAMVDDE